MRILFFNPEQYLSFENEPFNHDIRLPILNCGKKIEHKDYIYTRVFRDLGREEMNRNAYLEAREFRPNLVVYLAGWSHKRLDINILRGLMKIGIPILTYVADSHYNDEIEFELFRHCNYFALCDSMKNYFQYYFLSQKQPNIKEILFPVGQVFTDIICKQKKKKIYDVTMIGSNEGERVKLINFLKQELPKNNINFNKFGGLVDNEKEDLMDKWVSLDEYVRIIDQSKICLSSQTQPSRFQLKGKVFHYLSCGTLCLTDSNKELEQIIPDDCVVYYNSFEDCIEKIKYFISNEKERLEIIKKGHDWFVETFNYKEYWHNFLNRVEKNAPYKFRRK